MSKYTNILFTDIETVPAFRSYSDLGERDREVFENKFSKQIIDYSKKVADISITVPGETVEVQMNRYKEILYQSNAALHVEFGKIVSIGMGFITDSGELRVRTIVSSDEKYLLTEFNKVVSGMFSLLCGHNFNDFDGPYLCRRMIINGIKIPSTLNPSDKKPWELTWKDTMKMWGFSEWNAKISLDRLCYALGINTPKEDMDGSEVKDYFYGATPGPEDLPFGKFDKEEARFSTIAKYQAGDIVALVNCFLRLSGEQVIPEDRIKYV